MLVFPLYYSVIIVSSYVMFQIKITSTDLIKYLYVKSWWLKSAEVKDWLYFG